MLIGSFVAKERNAHSFVATERNDLIGYSVSTLYDETLGAYRIYIPLEIMNTLALHTWVFMVSRGI